MSSSEKEVFDVYMYSDTFPQDARGHEVLSLVKRMHGERIISYLKGNADDNKHFRHRVKRSGFRLLDFPEAGIRDALVVAVEEEKEVAYLSLISQLLYNLIVQCSQ